MVNVRMGENDSVNFLNGAWEPEVLLASLAAVSLEEPTVDERAGGSRGEQILRSRDRLGGAEEA